MSTLTKLPPHPHQHHHHHDHCRPGFPHPIPGPFTRSKYGVQLQRDYDLENRKYEIKSAKEYEQEVKSCEDEKNKEDDVVPAPLKKKTAADLNVGIVGGGMAGLYAALLLQDLGIKSHIFEASPRLGGRVYTKYFEGHDDSDPNKAAFFKYVDVGESRIPKMDIMDRFTGEHKHYSLYNVLNRHNHNKGEIPIKLIPYINENPTNLKLYNGQKLTIKDLELEKAKHHKSHEKDKLFDPFHFGTKYGGPVPDAYLTESHEKHLMQVLGKIVDTLEGDKDSFSQGFEGLKKVDALSVRAFLAGHCPDFNKKSLPSAVVNWIETLSTSTDRFEYAFTEFLLNHFEYGKHLIEEKKEHHKKEIKWQCVEGGMSRFVDVLEKHLLIRSSSAHRKDDHPEGTDSDDTGEEGTDAIISKGLKVVSIAPDAKDRTKLTITPVDVESGENAKVESFDHVINATPLSIMRNMDMNDCDLSFMQREALRSVHYETAVQVSMCFKTRFWEEDHEAKKLCPHAHLGGTSSTDNPLRTVIYPSYGGGKLADNEKASGVLIASHTHIQDAIRMSSLTGGTGNNLSEDPYATRRSHAVNDLCLKYLTELHGDKASEQYTHEFDVMDWGREEFQQGARAHFGPGQFSHYYPALVRPAAHGRLHFAGEATSVHHGWVVGSLNSAYRAVYQILKREGLDMEIDMLIGHWGVVDEVDYRADEVYVAQMKAIALKAKAAAAGEDEEQESSDELGEAVVKHPDYSMTFDDIHPSRSDDEDDTDIVKKLKVTPAKKKGSF